MDRKKKKIQLCAACKRVTSNLKTQTESDGMQKHVPYKWKKKKTPQKPKTTQVAILTSDKIGFKRL